MSKRKTSPKPRIYIRTDAKGDYVIAVMRPLPKKSEFNPQSEIYVCDTIEEMESVVSQLFRTGKVKR